MDATRAVGPIRDLEHARELARALAAWLAEQTAGHAVRGICSLCLAAYLAEGTAKWLESGMPPEGPAAVDEEYGDPVG